MMGIPNEMMYMTSLKTLYLQETSSYDAPVCLKMQLNGNLKLPNRCRCCCQGYLLRVFTEAVRGQMRTSIQLQFEPLASTMKTAVVVLTLKNCAACKRYGRAFNR